MIDSHAHVADAAFNEDRDAVAARARAASIRWVEIGTNVSTSDLALHLATDLPNDILGTTVGVHPSESSERLDWNRIKKLLDDSRVVAVGEVGLDYYRGGTKEQQLPVLKRFVELAVERSLPVVWHIRSSQEIDAQTDILSFLQRLPADRRPAGVMHTFSGTWEQAEEYLRLGLYISMSGVVTFKNAQAIKQVATKVPLNRLLIETDCPYLTPNPHRGARNEPSNIQLVARHVAELRGMSQGEIADTTEQNALALFQVKH